MPKSSYYLPHRKLVSQADQSMIERPDVPRSKFTGSWSWMGTFGAGLLIPFLVDEILPGDHMQYNASAYIRMQTPLFPLMSQQRIDTHWFFVPNRLVWSNWKRFMGEQDLGPTQDIESFEIPQTFWDGAIEVIPTNSLGDYFGLPAGEQLSIGIFLNALPFRAYNLIYNEWFRDQNLQAAATVNTGNGEAANALVTYPVRRRGKSHDYFTSALPWPQKFTAPQIPLAGDAPIVGLGFREDARPAYTGPIDVVETDFGVMGSKIYEFYREVGGSDEADQRDILYANASDDVNAEPRIYADLSSVTGISINVLRQAFLVQQLLERDARGGTRYTEIVKSHFGVTSPDARLQRPEYIGGGSSQLNVTPVAATAPTEGVPIGALGAAATAVGSHRASFAATEHGYVIGLISVRSELQYQQGIHRMWTRSSRLDFYWPSLAGLGEQAILRQEIFATGVQDEDEDLFIFGYQERWQEYRTRYSQIVGQFRSTAAAAGPMDQWHLAEYFETAPTLGPTFVVDNPPMDRVLATDTAEQAYLADILIHRTAVRPLPMYGTPVLLGKF
ncbi:major capsid protein [Microviridae sp.]|nr:major capsid protein [Microviridae sp.]